MKSALLVTSTYKTKDMTLEYLKSFKKINYKNYEIILIDDNSNDGTYEIVQKKFPKVVLIKNDNNLGFSKSNNLGIKKANGKFIILLNNDVLFPDKDIIKKLIYAFKKYKKVGMITCKVMGIDKKLQNHSRIKDTETEQEFNMGGGPLMFFDSKIIKKMKGFDEGFSPAYYEDLDLSLRLRKKGYKLIYTPKTYFLHKGGKTTKNVSNFYYTSTFKNGIRFSIIYLDLFYFLKFNFIEFIKSIYRKKLFLYIKAWIINLKEIKNLTKLRKERKLNIKKI